VAPLGNDKNRKMNTLVAPWTTLDTLRTDRVDSAEPQQTDAPAVWKDAAFLHYRAANILLQVMVWLFSHRLAPASALEGALRLSSRLQDRAAYLHAQAHCRRLRARL
jgi:hypothetical protein